jgi:trimeric autotransporter adhesin
LARALTSLGFSECYQAVADAKRNPAGMLAVLLLCLGTMVGCMGFSSSRTATVQAPTSTLSIGGSVLAFGTVTTGASKTLSMTLSNSGSASITVNSVSISSQAFSLKAPAIPTTIAAGQSAAITIAFTPISAGDIKATASIVSDASDGNASFSLPGTGISSGQLDANPASESFGTVTVGKQSTQTITLTNNSSSPVNISQVNSSAAAFTVSGIAVPVALSVSQSTTFTVTFAPQSTGNANGTVTITSDAPNSTISISLSGTGAAPGAVSASPSSLNFGTVQTGTTQKLTDTLTNTGGSSLTISKVGISGTSFTVSGITTPLTLGSGQSATFTVTYAPLTATAASGTVTVTSDGSNPTLGVALTGTGAAVAGQLSVSPVPVAVGSVVVGSSGAGSGTLTASGANVTVTGATSNNSRFVISGLSLPGTIAAGKSAAFSVTYSPLVAGADSATLTFTSNAQTTTITGTSTGAGTPAPVHTVALSWNASTSPNIAGYNIYRAVYVTSCGAYSKINGANLDTATTYTDSAVVDGTNYCYATTAVDTSNAESGYSNIVSNVQIPAP